MLISEPGKSGFLIPIRQYPLYTAALAQFFRSADSYYLDETNEWSTSVNEIRSILEKTRKEGKTQPKDSVIINPGNPTVALLDRKTQDKTVDLCEQYNLVLLADEVYSTAERRTRSPRSKRWSSCLAKTSPSCPSTPFRRVSLVNAVDVVVTSNAPI